jgi:hypothetical protein
MHRSRRVTVLFAAVLCLVFVVVAVDASAFVPTKSQWDNKKKEFNLPDGLAKGVKMGKAFDTYQAKLNLKDPQAAIGTIDKLVGDLAKYMNALKSLKDTKRKNKPIEKAAAFDYLKGVMGDLSKMKQNLKDILSPGLAVKRKIETTLKKAKKLSVKSPQTDFQKFYSEDYRGVGTSLGQLKKKCEVCKVPIEVFVNDATEVDRMVGGKPFNAKKTLDKIEDSLEWLRAQLDDVGAW